MESPAVSVPWSGRAYTICLQVLLPAYLLVAPFSTRSATLFLALLALAALPQLYRLRRMPLSWKPRGLSLLWVPFAIWFALSPIWAENPSAAFDRIMSMAGLAVLGMAAALAAFRRTIVTSMPDAALIVIAASALSFLFILRDPGLAGEASASDFNRCVISFAVIYWLVLLQIDDTRDGRFRMSAMAALVGCAIAVLMSDTQSAVFGLIAGHAAWLLATILPRFAFWLLATGTVLLMPAIRTAVAMLAMPLFEPLMQSSFMVRGSGSIRLGIWRDYLAMASDRFWMGYGPGTAPALEIKQRLVAAKGEGHWDFLGFIHPHNAYVQIWFDLGAIGALVATIALILLFWRLRETLIAQPRIMGLSACLIAVYTVSHGLYQSWWLSLMILSVIYGRVFLNRAS